jgi:ribose transport system permease protein
MATTSPTQPDPTPATETAPAAQVDDLGSLTLDQLSPGMLRQLRPSQLLRIRELGILIAAVAIFAGLAIARPNTFLTEFNLVNVVRSISLIGIVAVGMTFLFIAGELDLSVGSMYAFLSVMTAYLILESGWVWWLAAPAAILLGAGIGFFNGFVTTFFRIPSFIVTLGMLSALRGAALIRSGGTPVSGIDAPDFQRITSAYVFGSIPAQIFWFLGVLVVGGFVLAKTRFGYHVYATGDNAGAAVNAGIRTTRVKLACFVITGALTGLAGVISAGWLRSGSPITGQAFELDVIAAVIIGGTNLFGGSGSILGTFLGAAVAGMISNGLILLGADINSLPVAKGAVIILAVLLDVTIRRRQGL